MVRTQESRVVAHRREVLKPEFALAQRVINVGRTIITNTMVHHPQGGVAAGRIMLGLYGKILNGLMSIVTLTERGLPTASVMREMTETIIAMSYMATDPVPLTEKYIDGTIIRDLMDINRRRNSTDPGIRSSVSSEVIRGTEERAADVEARRGADEVRNMRRHGWAGIPLELMASKAGLPPIVYEGAYATDSGPAHAMDAYDYINVDDQGNLRIVLAAGRTMNHLMPAVAVAVQAMAVIDHTLQMGYEKTVTSLSAQMRELNAKRTPAAASPQPRETVPKSRS